MPTSANSTTTIAVLGVGSMGAPVAAQLISAGFDVRVWNRSPDRLGPLVAVGAVAMSTPAEAAADADVLVTMLTDGAAVLSVLSGPEGALATARSDALWLQMSTVGVDWTDRLGAVAADQGLMFVDAPVSGSVGPAREGALLILASGPDRAREAATPVLDALGRRTLWLGAAGTGSKAKLVLNNWLVD